MFRTILTKSAMAATALFFTPLFCKEKKREIYIWGNGVYQARPDALLQFQNFTPKKVDNLPQNLRSLAFGEYYEAGIDEKNNLYIWQKHQPDANVNEQNCDNKRDSIKLLHNNVKSVRFTGGYIWALTKDKKVYQWPIQKKFNENKEIISKELGKKREVEPLKGAIQLQTGRDHILTLNSEGLVYAMGDDTYGQCGQCDSDRNTSPPYTEKRISFPVQVKKLSNIAEIAVGQDHNLAMDTLGNLYGWGSNSNIQLSHEEEFSKMNNPLICTYTPLRINKGLDYSQIKKIAAGDQFSIIVTENTSTEGHEVFSCGTNLKGQLGINQMRHVKDISKIDKLSNYVLKVEGKEKKVQVEQIQCGKNHCIALLNIGYVMEWGDNEYGQMGNKKRSSVIAPIVVRDFIGKKVVGVFAGQNNSGVICESEE